MKSKHHYQYDHELMALAELLNRCFTIIVSPDHWETRYQKQPYPE